MKTFYALSFKKAMAALILMFAFTAVSLADPQYYNYDNGTVDNSFPLNQGAVKMIQTLIGPGEFTQPSAAPNGNIVKYSLRISATYPLGPVTYTSFRVLFLDTNLTALPTSLVNGNWDTVFYRASYGPITQGVNTWMDIVLDHPHAYNNTKSLLVQIEQCAATGTFAGFSLKNTTTASNRRTYSVGGCPFSYQGTSLYVTNCGIDVTPPVVNCNYTWATQTSGTTNLLQAVWAVNGSVVWAAGAAATVRKSTDGGVTWGNGNPNPGVITGDVYNICAFDANNAWLTTSPGATFIYRTTNGGTNWTQVFTQAGGFIDAIIFKDANTGFAYGDPVSTRWSLWKSTNGGATWDSTGMYLLQAGSEAGWNNAMCVIGNDVWFGTNNTKVYHSTNFGATGSWTAGVTTGNINTFGVWFTSSTNGLCDGALVQVSTNGGSTWTNGGTVGGTGNMTSLGGSGSNFWLTRGNNIYGSTNNGAAWTGAGYTGTQPLWATSITTAANLCLTGWCVGAAGTIVKLTGVPTAITNNQ